MAFEIQTGTLLNQGPFSADFRIADYDGDGVADLFALLKDQTGSGRSEVHVLSGRGMFQSFLLQRALPLHPTSNEWQFDVADYDRDGTPDLFAVLKAGSSSEIHVLSGRSSYQTFLLQQGIDLPWNGDEMDLDFADANSDGVPDLYVFGTAEDGRFRSVILSGAASFRTKITDFTTGLVRSVGLFTLRVFPWDRDPAPDLVAIKRRETGTQSTEVHVISGASNFQQPIYQRGSLLEETGSNFQFDVARFRTGAQPSVFAIKQYFTGTAKVEVHALYPR